MIKVANIIEEARLGGPQIRIILVSKKLYQLGVHTTVFLPKLNSEQFQEQLVEQRIDYRIKTIYRLTREKKILIRYFLFFFYEIWALYLAFKKGQYDIVHVSGGAWQYKGVIAGKLSGSKVIWHLNDSKMPFMVKLVFKIIAKYFADAFIFAANRVKEFYFDKTILNNKPAFEIQAPVDCNQYDPKIIKSDIKINNHRGIKIVTVANINPAKGLEYFIEMAHQLNQNNKNLSFWIVGSVHESQKKYYSQLKKQIDRLKIENIRFYGFCKDVRPVLKATDIYICSSFKEASPISVWEAMSMEKPIVSTDVGDVSRFITNGENGLIVPVGSSELLAEKVNVLILNKKLSTKLGMAARRVAMNQLDINICAQRHYAAYENILHQDKSLLAHQTSQ